MTRVPAKGLAAVRVIFWVLVSLLLLSGALTVGVKIAFSIALPKMDGALVLKDLNQPVLVDFGEHGVPRISAKSKPDAFRALGYMTARDRLFQMDMMRRRFGGDLAEVFGESAIESDSWHRTIGFKQAAHRILAQLPDGQMQVLDAYAQGVNSAIREIRLLPIEFAILGYKPVSWTTQDSLLIALGMFETLSWTEASERMLTVMKATLPAAVYRFFTPDGYCPASRSNPMRDNACELTSPSIKDLGQLFRSGPLSHDGASAGISPRAAVPRGSNAWVVGPSKTKNGRAMLANDMHLELGVPNIWYRADIHYGDKMLVGFTLPGLPLVIGGSNGKVAWGLTNVNGGDVLDLVALTVRPGESHEYLAEYGFARMSTREERIHVRNADDHVLVARETQWGPVLPVPLLGGLVSVHWTALEPHAVDLSMLALDEVSTANEALSVFNRAGVPPMNALVADSQGNIGWTIAGKLPIRSDFDGSTSVPWANPTRKWVRYIDPTELPRIINPPEAFIANANERMVGESYQFDLGHGYGPTYRKERINERLGRMRRGSERDMLELQLDTKADFYEYYRRLAMKALKRLSGRWSGDLATLWRTIESWDGRADSDSTGIALLAEFQQRLQSAVLSQYFKPCIAAESGFDYAWGLSETSVRSLLDADDKNLVKDASIYEDWESFLVTVLEAAARSLMARHDGVSLDAITWGMENDVELRHPLAESLPILAPLLDIGRGPMTGCGECVRWSAHRGGATERLVVSPGHESEGIFHMPGGQSGNAFSPYYADQQRYWQEGRALPFLDGSTEHHLLLQPEMIATARTAGTVFN